ncbi:MAG TPA: hypothetical protein VFZ59_22400 [Verrucomicrobiae bacterium]|nr:hypothetical protein [Verrucomicrobiae bacterium]
MPGRLNIFQRVMLQWNELHPYNAVHVVRIQAVLDPERLGNVIRHLLVRLGLTGLQMDTSHGGYDYQGGPAQCEIKLVSEADPYTALVSEVERQLNTRFPSNQRFTPFRFFIVPEAGSFLLGLIYFHPVADAEAVVFLLRRIVETYFVPGEGGDVESLDLYPPPRDGLLGQPKLLMKKLAAIPGMIFNMRRSCRPNYRDVADSKVGVTLFFLPPGSLPKLMQASKAWSVTINDVFLALLARSVAPLASHAQKRGRPELSLGCIVNLRRDLGLQGPRTFGLFLGSFIVTQPLPSENGRLREIAVAVRERTERMKRDQLYLTSALELRFGRRMMGFFSTRERRKLYQKHYPLWGGITNMNLNPLWPQPMDGTSFDYFRAVSTGPVTPLVMSVTTVGENVSIGLTFRRTVFSPEDITGIQNNLLETVSGRELAI